MGGQACPWEDMSSHGQASLRGMGNLPVSFRATRTLPRDVLAKVGA